MIALDFTGGTHELKGQTFLTVIDYYSRYPFAFEVRATSGEEIVRHLKSLFATVGFPRIAICDNGPAFIGDTFKTFMRAAGVRIIHSSTYYPQGNGVVERFHGTFKSRIIRTLEDGVTLSTAVNQSLFDVRSSTNDSTGKTPFFLFFGRDMPTRWHNLATPQVQKPARELHDTYIARNEKRHAKILPFQVGDTVLIANGQGCKFRHYCEIARELGHGAWIVRHQGGREQSINQRFMRPVLPHVDNPEAQIDPEPDQPVPQRRYPDRGNQVPDAQYRD